MTLNIGSLELASPVLMAPMAGYTDLPFRRCLRSLGGLGLAFTEMLNPTSLLRGGGAKRDALLATHPEDRPLGYQVYGKDPELIALGAKWCEEHGAPLVDINMGCPQKRISGKGSGAGLLRKPDLAVEIVRRVLAVVTVPMTVKLRLGWDNTDTAVELTRSFEKEGVAAVTIHGRTRVQSFGGTANLDEIRRVVETAERIPVIANGDIVSVESAREMFARTGCAGIMLGRHPLRDPWIIRDIARDLRGEPPLPPPGAQERTDFVVRHFQYSVDLYGERSAVLLFRKWLPRYLSGYAIERSQFVGLLQITDVREWRERVPKALLESPPVRTR